MKKGCIAAFCYLIFAALMVSQGLFSSKLGLDLDSLYSIKPWSDLASEGMEDCNPSLSHEAFFIYPWFKFAFDHLSQGEIPLWTHLAGGGNPFMGNLSCACFYPLNLLGMLIPFATFWSLAGLIKLWLGALLTYFLLRRYRLQFLSSLFGGFAFGFCGFQICWLNHPYSNVIFFLPALFLAAEYFIHRRSGLALVLNALLIGLQFLGGSPEASFLICLSWVLYLIYRIRQEVELFSSEGLKLLFYVGLIGFLGALLSAFQLVPFFEYLLNSHGLNIRARAAYDFMNGGPGRLFSLFGVVLGLFLPIFAVAFIGLLQRKNTIFVGVWSGLLGGLCLIVSLRIAFWLGAKPHLLLQVFPELYGYAAGGCKTIGEISYSALNGGYAGVVTAFLALYTLVAPCKRRPLPFFIFLFIISFGVAHSIPWLSHALKMIPVLGLIHNSCLLSLTAFSIAVIAPFGLEDLLYRAAHIKGKSAAIMGVMAAVLVISWAVMVSGWSFFETGVHLMAGDRDPDPGVIILQPENGSFHNGIDSFTITGRAKADVEQVKAYMDDLFVGEMRTLSATASDNALLSKENQALATNYPKCFTFQYPLDTLDEGTYTTQVMPSRLSTGDPNDRAGDWADLRLVRNKRISEKDGWVLCLSVFVFLLLILKKIPVPVRASCLILMLLVDLSLFGMGYNKPSSQEDIFPRTDVTDFLSRQKGPFRVFTEGGIMYPNTNFIYGIEHMEWDDRLGVARYGNLCEYIKLDHLAKPRQLNVYNFNLTHPLIDFMGIKYILVQKEVDLSEISKFKLVHESSVKIYENTMARDRAFIVGDWLMQEEVNPAHLVTVNLRDQPVLHRPLSIEKGGRGTVRIEEYQDEYIRLAVETEGQTLLVVTDNDYPGWEATLDGKPVPIERITVTFRGVALEEEGRHLVEFFYRPFSFRLGIGLSAFAGLICLLFLLIPPLTAVLRRKSEIEDVYVDFP